MQNFAMSPTHFSTGSWQNMAGGYMGGSYGTVMGEMMGANLGGAGSQPNSPLTHRSKKGFEKGSFNNSGQGSGGKSSKRSKEDRKGREGRKGSERSQGKEAIDHKTPPSSEKGS